MKFPLPFLFLLFSLITLQSHPQTEVKIGKSIELVYPLSPK